MANNVFIGAVSKFPVKLAKESLQDTMYYLREGSHFKGFNATQAKLRLSNILGIDKDLPYSVYGNVLAIELVNKHGERNFVKTYIKEYNIGQRSDKGIFEIYAK
jgi:hypothetical protein